MYWRRDSKKALTGREREGWHLRAKHFGLAFANDLRIPEKRPLLVRTRA